MINERERLILKKTLENSNISLDEFCNIFNVSKRTIQYNINNINYYLSKNNINKIVIKSGKLIISSKKEIEIFLNEIVSDKEISKEDRIKLIYLYSIFNENGLNISYLSKKLDISRNTLKQDMNNIEDEKFTYIHSKGYFLNKSNEYKIKFLDSIYNEKILKEYIKEVLNINLITKIENFIKEVSELIKINTNEEIYQKILITIYILIKYPEKNNKISGYVTKEDKKLIKNVYIKYFKIDNSFEIISEMLIGLSINPNLNSWIDEIFLIRKMINYVSLEINLDLTKDNILFDFLSSHIKVSIYRLKKNIMLKNTVYEQLISEKDPIIKIIKKAVTELEEIFKIKFTEIEISLIAYHFKASIERINIFNRKKIVLVCGLGYGTSRILEYSLKEKFDIDIVDVMPAYMIDTIDLKSKNVDYILSTIELENINYIKINPLLKNEDFDKLDKLGIKRRRDKIIISEILDEIEECSNNLERDKLETILLDKYSNIFTKNYKPTRGILDNLTKDNVIFLDKVNSWEEAINILGNMLENRNSVSKGYICEMITLIKKYGPYIVIGNDIALPHFKSEKEVYKTDYAMLILKEPIYFNKDKKASIFLCFSSKDDKEHLDVLSDFYELILNEKFVEKMKRTNKFEELFRLIETRLQGDKDDI